jgi:hypothetical protein
MRTFKAGATFSDLYSQTDSEIKDGSEWKRRREETRRQ